MRAPVLREVFAWMGVVQQQVCGNVPYLSRHHVCVAAAVAGYAGYAGYGGLACLARALYRPFHP